MQCRCKTSLTVNSQVFFYFFITIKKYSKEVKKRCRLGRVSAEKCKLCANFSIFIQKIMQHTNYYYYKCTNGIHITTTCLAKCRQTGGWRMEENFETSYLSRDQRVYYFCFVVFAFTYCFYMFIGKFVVWMCAFDVRDSKRKYVNLNIINIYFHFLMELKMLHSNFHFLSLNVFGIRFNFKQLKSHSILPSSEWRSQVYWNQFQQSI